MNYKVIVYTPEPDPPFLDLGELEWAGNYDPDGEEMIPDCTYTEEIAQQSVDDALRVRILRDGSYHSGSKEEPFTKLDVYCAHETPKALLIYLKTDDVDYWVPKSQILSDSQVLELGDHGDIVVARWIAEQKGWV